VELGRVTKYTRGTVQRKRGAPRCPAHPGQTRNIREVCEKGNWPMKEREARDRHPLDIFHYGEIRKHARPFQTGPGFQENAELI